MSGMAHFFMSVGGSKFHERLAHFFIDIYRYWAVDLPGIYFCALSGLLALPFPLELQERCSSVWFANIVKGNGARRKSGGPHAMVYSMGLDCLD